MTILGLCNLTAPGIWGAMNSLGAGGAETARVVNAANALTFCLMVVSCYFSSALIHYIGIKGALVFGTIGYAPFAAGLYTNNCFGTEWFVLFGAALCGISAGVFWASEAAIAISYPEPWNRGKALGYWLTFRLFGQILGGAINLGINANDDHAGKASYVLYLIFIAIQALGPFVALLLNRPAQVERRDGRKVVLSIVDYPWTDIRETSRDFLKPKFLMVVLWIGQSVFAEAVYFTYLSLWFTVRARALGSFLSGIVAMTAGNILGHWRDHTNVPLKFRARITFGVLVALSGAWWLWATVLATRFRQTRPTYDWSSPGFGAAFAVYIFLTMGLQTNYLFLYSIITNLAQDESEVIRYAALLRGTESAWQAVSYGLTSVPVFGEFGGIYINFGLWAVGIFPAWLVLREFGTSKQFPDDEGGVKEGSELEREKIKLEKEEE
ncbi:major facilitator superfamily transporter [Mycena polygramma]|nr:major facilitator superfamily transporter [Mycena polygramma]